MFHEFNDIFNLSLSFGELLKNLLASFFCGITIAFFYKRSYSGPGYLNSFVNALVILTMITSIVIMVIGNNLARAFGLVGAMSIIRFRTAVKETQDIIFIFFSLAVGMAAGVGLHALAFLSTISIGGIALFLNKSKFVASSQRGFLLQLNTVADLKESDFNQLFLEYLTDYKLVNSKAIISSDEVEYSYYVNFKNKKSSAEFLQNLRKIEGIIQINMFYDEEYF